MNPRQDELGCDGPALVCRPRARVRWLRAWLLAAVASALGASADAGTDSLHAVRRDADSTVAAARRSAALRTPAAHRAYLRAGYRRRTNRLIRRAEALGSAGAGADEPVARLRAAAALARVVVAADGAPTPRQQARVETLLVAAKHAARIGQRDTAVEIEAETNDSSWDVLTTHDGTVGAILRESGASAPPFLRALAAGGAPEDVAWDALSTEQKRALVLHATRGQSFFANRRMPGLRLRSKTVARGNVGVSFSDGTRVPALGVVQLPDAVLPYVEFASPKAVTNLEAIEYHVRAPGPASANYHDARQTLGVFADVGATGTHIHVPGFVRGVLRPRDALQRVRFVNAYRVANTYLELSAVYRGRPLERVVHGSATFVDMLPAEGLAMINRHLATVADGGTSDLPHSALKLAAVGFRTGELYGKRAMFGFEVRMANAIVGGPGRFLDAVQTLALGGAGTRLSFATRRWYARHVVRALDGRDPVEIEGEALARLHYNRPISALLADAPEPLRDALSPEVVAVLERIAPQNYAAKLLVHDWSRDPVLSGDPATLARTVAAQRAVLARLHRTASALGAAAVTLGNNEMVRFVEDSGLLSAFSRAMYL